MAACPGAIGIDHIIRGCGCADAGFVVWNNKPPAGTPWHAHRDTLIEAMHTALAFCGTDTRDEWCVLGSGALILMRSITGFEQVEAVPCPPFVYIGKHKTTLMYTDAAPHRPPRSGNEFVCGVGSRAVRVLIKGGPMV
jgi:hypothetical protein